MKEERKEEASKAQASLRREIQTKLLICFSRRKFSVAKKRFIIETKTKFSFISV